MSFKATEKPETGESNYNTVVLRLEFTNASGIRLGGVLVQTDYSAVSAGQEGMKDKKEGKISNLGKAGATRSSQEGVQLQNSIWTSFFVNGGINILSDCSNQRIPTYGAKSDDGFCRINLADR